MSDPENRDGASDASAPPEEAAGAPSTAARTRRARRASRRWRALAGLLAVLIGAALGAAVGWGSQVPIYQGQGLIYISPILPSPQDPGGRDVLPMFEGFVEGQVPLLRTRRAAMSAMGTPAWREVGEPTGVDAVERFEARRTVLHEPGTQHIRVRFHDPRPEVAQAGVRALVAAYEKLARELNDADERLEYARAQVEVLNGGVRNVTNQILTLTQEYGGAEGLQARHAAAVEQMLAAEKDLERVRSEIRRLENDDGDAGDRREHTVGEIAVESPEMAQYLTELELLEADVRQLAARGDESGERILALGEKLRALDRRIERFANAWNRRRAEAPRRKATREQLGAAEAALRARLDSLRTLSRKIGQIRVEAERLHAEREEVAAQVKRMAALRDQLESQQVGAGRIQILDAGLRPTEPHEDARTLSAWIGGALGGLAGLLLVLLLAALVRRLGPAGDTDAYHARVRAAAARLPKRIGEWEGQDVEALPGATPRPVPNVLLGRRFQNPSTGENATLQIVQCEDARDLTAHYPPISYPAQGWTLREAEPRHLPALLAAIPGTVYRFTKETADGSSEVVVYNFFARPDGSIESGPAGALHAAAETRTHSLGAAQFQLLLGPSMTPDRRDEVFRTLIAAALPVLDALCAEDDA